MVEKGVWNSKEEDGEWVQGINKIKQQLAPVSLAFCFRTKKSEL